MISNHLRYFIEVADQKSFTKAAEKLYISQSTISKAVASLETELQTSLFEHGKRNFALTPSGKLLYAFATDVYDENALLKLTGGMNVRSMFRILD